MRNVMSRFLESLFGMALLCACCCAGQVAAQTIAAPNSANYSLAVSADGRVYGWGNDGYGQLGVGRALYSSVPIATPGINLGQGVGRTRVATGWRHMVAVKSDGAVWAWGDNGSGQLGDGTKVTRSAPAPVPGLTSIVAVAAGGYHTVALSSNGSIWTWGANSAGQLGDGTKTGRVSPVQVPGISGVAAIAAGGYHTLALKSDGSVWVWGWSFSGSPSTGSGSLVPVQVPELSGIVAISAGYSHSIAVKADGTLWTWGGNSNGALGDGTNIAHAAPAQVPTLAGVRKAAAGHSSTVALTEDGSVWETATVMEGDGVPRYIWRQVSGLSGIADVAAGSTHSLAFGTNGSVWAWGSNRLGQLGDGSAADRYVVLPVRALEGATTMTAGLDNAMAVKSDGSIWTWGSNDSGQLGDGGSVGVTKPSQMSGLAGVVSVAAGTQHTLVLKSDGSVWAAGNNNSGRLGDGGTANSSSPVPVAGISSVAAVAAGADFSLGLKSDGTVWAWGTNFFGQLGDGTTASTKPPKQIGGLASVSAIAAANQGQSYAITANGSLWAWGRNDRGQLGVASTDTCTVGGVDYSCSLSLKLVGSGYKAIAAGHSHAIAIKSDGTLWAWGKNENGQLGDGTTTDRSSPFQVPGMAGVRAVAAGGKRSLAVLTDGSVWETSALPAGGAWQQVAGLSGAVAVAAGTEHRLAVKADGSVWAWGSNSFGQIGDGTLANRPAPVLVVNTSADNFLNLQPGTEFEVPPAVDVPFFTDVTKNARVSGRIKFDATAQDKAGSVYALAYLPPSTPLLTEVATADATGLVPAVLTASGWKPIGDTTVTEAAFTGTLNTAADTYNLFDVTQFDTTKDVGVFCLGYAAGGGTKSANGVSRAVVTGVGTVPDCPQIKLAQSVTTTTATTSTTTATTTTTTLPGTVSAELGAGWNLVGNAAEAPITVATTFDDATRVTSVWKWVPSGAAPGISYPTWALYAPGLSNGGRAYAASKGYEFLTTIRVGEGFWVNAKAAFALLMPRQPSASP